MKDHVTEQFSFPLLMRNEPALESIHKMTKKSSLEATLCSSMALINTGLGDIYVSEQ